MAPPLLRFATLLSGDRAAGEDLLQGVLEKTYRRWSRVGQVASPDAYVREALVNAARRQWQRRSLRPERLVQVAPEVGVSGGQSAVVIRQTLLHALSG